MRAFDCGCGEYLQADNDGKLLESMKQHVQRDHAGEDFPESRLREMRDQKAYDVREESSADLLI